MNPSVVLHFRLEHVNVTVLKLQNASWYPTTLYGVQHLLILGGYPCNTSSPFCAIIQ